MAGEEWVRLEGGVFSDAKIENTVTVEGAIGGARSKVFSVVVSRGTKDEVAFSGFSEEFIGHVSIKVDSQEVNVSTYAHTGTTLRTTTVDWAELAKRPTEVIKAQNRRIVEQENRIRELEEQLAEMEADRGS